MKKQYRIINKGKGVLNINPSNLNKVEQPITALDALYEYVDTKDDEVLDAANTYTDNSISIVNNTITEIDDRLSNLEYPDAILRRGSITLDNTTVKIPAYSFLIRINQREITNPTAYSGLITPATDGYNRIDIITINELGYFTKVTGEESLSIAVKPQPLPNTLEITSINIKGNVISPPVVTDTAKLDRGGYTGGSAMTLYQEITAFVLANSSARPYKVYTALLTQSGTSAPVATVLENTLGGTITWVRYLDGRYRADLSYAGYILNKTIGFATPGGISLAASNQTIKVFVGSNASELIVYTIENGVLTDGILHKVPIEIRVYN